MMRIFASIVLLTSIFGTQAHSGEFISCEVNFSCKPDGVCTKMNESFDLISTDEGDRGTGLHLKDGKNVTRLGKDGNSGYLHLNNSLEGFRIIFFGEGDFVWIPFGEIEDHIRLGRCE